MNQILLIFSIFVSDTFGWDQSEKFVKIYLTSLNDANKLKDSDVRTTFTAK